MRCAYYCCGDSYDLIKIADHFNGWGCGTKIHDNEVMIVKLSKAEDKKEGYLFVFSYGCISFWGLDAKHEAEILTDLSTHLTAPLETYISESCIYNEDGEETEIDEENDTISLHSDDPYLKLSFAYGLTQSVKLVSFEISVDKSIENNKNIPSDIIRSGKINYSNKDLTIKIGELLQERHSINLHSTILDTPEFFWRRPKYEQYYEMGIDFMDVEFRLGILNNRLEVLNELYEVLSNELHHKHTSRLEIIIIVLIFIEIVIALLKEFF